MVACVPSSLAGGPAETLHKPCDARRVVVDQGTTIRLCCPLSVELEGHERALPGRQGRLVFAYLVVHRRRAVGRDELIELLWPEQLPADPGEALSALLSRVRRALGGDVLGGRRELEVRLPPGSWVDLEAAIAAAERADAALAVKDHARVWEAASAALEIVNGGFLVGDDVPWSEDRRREVQQLRLRCLEAIAAAGSALGGGRAADAERAARDAVEAAPFRESGHRLLMAALAAQGNTAEALRAYERLRVLLRDELGSAPGADVQALHRRLLTGAPAVGDAAPAPRREERKLIAVLCAELPGVAEPIDPEELALVETEALRRTRALVERFGATVQESAAGALVALFGAPVAHEDDAERAVSAALRLCELQLASRVGVASGEAIIGAGGRAVGAVTGSAGALARRAPSGRVAVDEATVTATAHVCEPLSADAWLATGGERPATRVASPVTRLVGRDRELALLQELRASVLAERRPRLVTIMGEAGIGKSRLLDELCARVEQQAPGTVHRGRCLAYGEGITYWALREILWDVAGILLDDSGAVAAGKLTRLAAGLLDDAGEVLRVTSALAVTAGIALPAGALGEASPETVAEEIALAWPRLLSALAARAPVVVAIEDLHRADPALLDMVERIVARTEGPLLLLATARPELVGARPGWSARPGRWQITLDALSADATRALVADLFDAPDPSTAGRVAEIAEGNPFYAEEIVRHLEETSGAAPPIPNTIRALLAARIDALPEDEKAALQHAAVVGRRFWAAALEPTWAQAPLGPRLTALEQRGFVTVQPSSLLPGQRELAFVHGLTREVAYQSIPRGARCRVHAAVVEWIEGLIGDRREEFVELLAHHYEAAAAPADAALAWPAEPERIEQLRAAAVDALLEAGEAARRRLAIPGALRFAERGLALARSDRERLEALTLRARSLHAAVRGDDGLAAYLEAIEIAQRLGEAEAVAELRAHATLLCSRYPGSFTGPDWRERADELVAQGLAESGEHEVSFATGALLVARAWGTWRRRDPIAEDLPGARRDALRGAEIAEEIGSSLLLSIALEALTWIAFSQGDCEAASLGERHLRAAARLGDRFEANESLNMAVISYVRGGQFERAREIADEVSRQAPALGSHRALHAVASQAIVLVPGGHLAELREATDQVDELVTLEGERMCANAMVAVAARALALHECRAQPGAAEAIALFERISPVSRPLVRWGPWIIEALRGIVGLEESLARLACVEVRAGSGNVVSVLRTELHLRALAGDWDRAGQLGDRTRALATTTCAPALRCVADWAQAVKLADDDRVGEAIALAGAATAALAALGERYNAARLMGELLARLGDEAPAPVVCTTAEQLDAMGAHASADGVRAAACAHGRAQAF
jgi:DNA-binding SARP family transcriptional activator